MDRTRDTRINTFLSLKGMTVDTIPKSRLSKLEMIDTAIQNRLSEIEKAKAILKDSSINISVISNDTGISRKTFYNNDIFKEYVEYYSTSVDDEKTVSESELESVRFKNEELQKQINGFVLRDIESENLRHVIDELNAEIKNLRSYNNTLEQKYAEAQHELVDLKQNNVSAKNIVQLNDFK